MPPLIPALWVRRALKPRVAPDPPQFTTEPPRYAGVPKPHDAARPFIHGVFDVDGRIAGSIRVSAVQDLGGTVVEHYKILLGQMA
jgi:hypothetical protein